VTRHGVYTVAVVGASRRFLAQIRTHRIGIDFTSASLQYQNVLQTAQFVVPYNVFQKCEDTKSDYPLKLYYHQCEESMTHYSEMLDDDYTNDEAGYVACQALRNVLLITANAEAWRKVIEKRTCNRNTVETQYVVMKIWEALLQTKDGELMFGSAGPECLNSAIRRCRQGKMCCGQPLWGGEVATETIIEAGDVPGIPTIKFLQTFMKMKWPLLYK
jgi:thymidylate synthase (FAD)